MLQKIVNLMMTMKVMVMAELVREGEDVTFECTSSQWKFCEWNLTKFQCLKTRATVDPWCNQTLGIKWTPGEECGVQILNISSSMQGHWIATVIKDEVTSADKCSFIVEVATKSLITVGRTPSKFIVGQPQVLQCTSKGGYPSPVISAYILSNNNKRYIELNEQQYDSSNTVATLNEVTRYFQYFPHVEDRADSGTFLVCEATQSNEGDILYTTNQKEEIKIVYLPQPRENIEVISELNSTATVSLKVDAFPIPYYSDIIWVIEGLNGRMEVDIKTNSKKYAMNVASIDNSTLNISLSLHSLNSDDIKAIHTLSVKNSIGFQNYTVHFETFSTYTTGYIILTFVLLSIFSTLIIISFIINAKKTNKLCWANKNPEIIQEKNNELNLDLLNPHPEKPILKNPEVMETTISLQMIDGSSKHREF